MNRPPKFCKSPGNVKSWQLPTDTTAQDYQYPTILQSRRKTSFSFFAGLFYIAAFILLTAAGTPLYAGDTETAPDFLLRPASEAFQDKDTGLSFPARISEFSKVRVRRNLNPVFGTTIRYESESENYADIYLYALDTGAKEVTGEQFSENFADTVKGILKLAGQSKQIRSVNQSEHEFQIQTKTAFRSAFFKIQTDEGKLDSLLVMALYRGRIVKIRITYDSEAEDEHKSAIEFAQTILNMLVPPETTSPKKEETTETKAEKANSSNEGKISETKTGTGNTEKKESAPIQKPQNGRANGQKTIQVQ